MNTLTITHNAGFFSCCSVRLHEIINYFNINKTLPEIVDSSVQFDWYKLNHADKSDITFEYFEDCNNNNNNNNNNNVEYITDINYNHQNQFSDFSTIKYADIHPFIEKYFSPSIKIKNIITDLEAKYDMKYDNMCLLFYRGNDKITETHVCGYDEYYTRAKQILDVNPNTIFWIQSDETEFIEEMLMKFPNNSFYMKDEIRHMKKCINTVDKIMRDKIDVFSKKYLAITIMMSKCKYIVCGSGNCSIWIMFYRNNNANVCQNLNEKWIININNEQCK